ncbi:MAG: hypothetical protein M0Z49_04420 [Chloroflexi bacterium]|nr:hypothetical protein [Chloroflexota bacterium]
MNGEPHGAGHRAEDDALTGAGRADDDRFERDLRAVVRRHAPSEAPEALRARVSAIAQPVRQPSPVARASGGGARRRWLQPATGLAAAVVVALIGGLLVLARPGVGPAASVAPSVPSSSERAAVPSTAASMSPATPAPSPEATPSVLSTPFTAAGFTWQPLVPRTGNLSTPVITPLVPGEYVAATLPGGSGFVAVGFREADAGASADADAWYSTDGVHFVHATIAGGTDATMDGLTVAPDGTLVAFGTDGYSPNTQDITTRGTAIWTSSDGRTWTRQPAQASLQGALLQHVVRQGSTYVAVGQSPVGVPHLPAGAPQPPIWTSSDAVHWDRVAASPIFPSSQGHLLVNGLAWTGARFVAVGNLLGGTAPYAWTSRDGRTWAATDMSATFPARPTGGAEPTAVAVVGSTILAVGWSSAAATEPVVWRSADGTKWTRVDLPGFLGGIILSSIDVSGAEVEVHGEQLDSGGQLPQGTPVQWALTPAPAATPLPGPRASAAAQVSAVSPPIPVPTGTRTDAIDGVGFFSAERGLLVGGTGGEGGFVATGEGIVWRTDDGGAHWTTSSVAPGPLRSVAVVGSALAWTSVVCGSGDPSTCRPELLQSQDGGVTWQTIADRGFVALDFVDATHGWGLETAGVPQTLETTTDAGRTWSAAPTQPCRTAPLFGAVGVSFTDSLHGWVACTGMGAAGNSDKAAVATDDGGRSWHVVAGTYQIGGYPLASVGSIPELDALWGIGMRANGAGLIWMPLGGADGTWCTADGGGTWSDIQMGAEPGAFGALAGWLVDDTTWFLVLDATPPAEQLVRSTDGGRTWQAIGTPG